MAEKKIIGSITPDMDVSQGMNSTLTVNFHGDEYHLREIRRLEDENSHLRLILSSIKSLSTYVGVPDKSIDHSGDPVKGRG